jgi:hypothetical protein
MVEASGLLPQARRRGLWEKAWPGAETVAQGQEEGEHELEKRFAIAKQLKVGRFIPRRGHRPPLARRPAWCGGAPSGQAAQDGGGGGLTGCPVRGPRDGPSGEAGGGWRGMIANGIAQLQRGE